MSTSVSIERLCVFKQLVSEVVSVEKVAESLERSTFRSSVSVCSPLEC